MWSAGGCLTGPDAGAAGTGGPERKLLRSGDRALAPRRTPPGPAAGAGATAALDPGERRVPVWAAREPAEPRPSLREATGAQTAGRTPALVPRSEAAPPRRP